MVAKLGNRSDEGMVAKLGNRSDEAMKRCDEALNTSSLHCFNFLL
jgi:hypothetical protein